MSFPCSQRLPACWPCCAWQCRSELQRNSTVQEVQYDLLRDQIAALEAQLQAEASLLSASEFQYGAPDWAAKTVPLTVSVTPKAQTPGATTAALVCNVTPYPMEPQANGRFAVTLDLPLLERVSLEQILLTENGRQQVEPLHREEMAGADTVAHPMVWLTGSYQADARDGQVRLRTGALMIQQAGNPWTLQSVTVVATAEGKEVGRTPVAFQPPAEADPAAASASLEVPFEGQYPVPNGSTLTLTAEVTDDQGLRYCIPLATFPVGQNGMLEQQGPPEADPNEPTQIYTPQGALLWQGAMDTLF